jgi:glycopeptide antibiotics resistance protein
LVHSRFTSPDHHAAQGVVEESIEVSFLKGHQAWETVFDRACRRSLNGMAGSRGIVSKITHLFCGDRSRQQPFTVYSTPPPMHEIQHVVPLLFAVYVAYLVIFGFVPFKTVIETSASFTDLYVGRFEGIAGITAASNWDIWTNIVLFIPYGMLFVGVPAVSGQPWWTKIMLAAGSAGLLSLAVEVGQLLLPRAPSVVDVACNTTGAIGGAIIGIASHRRFLRFVEWLWRAMQARTTSAVFLAGYFLVLSLVLALPLPLCADFINWNPKFYLQLGNEGTLDRPWRGEIYLAAVYTRALNDQEVLANFTAGPSLSGIPNRAGEGLVLFYDFSEGEGDHVHDRAGSAGPVDLGIHDPDHVRWLSPNGLLVEKETILISTEPARKLSADRFSAHSELTVEVWVAPADLSQGGPARILSYSKDPYHRNFTLAQQGGNIVFRLRTPVSGLNGINPELRTRNQPLSSGIQHLVVTYHEGIETLYLDGVRHAEELLRSEVLMDMMQGLLGSEFRWPLLSVTVFPLGLLTYLFFHIRRPVDPVVRPASMAALAGILFIKGLRWVILKMPLEPAFLLVSAGTMLASIVFGVCLVKSIGSGDRRTVLLTTGAR